MKKRLKFALIILLALTIALFDTGYSVSKTPKKKAKPTRTTSKTKAKKSSKRKGTKSKKKKPRVKIITKSVSLNYVSTLLNQELSDGIVYKKLLFGKSNNFIVAHLIEANIGENYPNSISIIKSKNLIDELDYPKNIFDDYQFDLSRIFAGELYAIVNGNFWMAYLNYPIGPLVIDGEVLSMKRHKNWSSAFFDNQSRMYIDNFEILGEIYLPNGKTLSIDNVNRRTSPDQIVIYNKYFGQNLPKIHTQDTDTLLLEALSALKQENISNDSTDVSFDTTEFRNQIVNLKQSESIEFATKKVIVEWLDAPKVNRIQKVRVKSIDTTAVAIPGNGYVISFPPELFPKSEIKIGDTISILFKTDRLRYIPFLNAISGTPRIVRRGRAKPEAYEEGSRGRRFIASQLGRTAIGTNLSKTKIYLLVIEPTNRKNNIWGASLKQLSIIMKKIGAYDAMNLDGGSSSVMVVSGNKVSSPNIENSRKISVAVGIIRNNHSKSSE